MGQENHNNFVTTTAENEKNGYNFLSIFVTLMDTKLLDFRTVLKLSMCNKYLRKFIRSKEFFTTYMQINALVDYICRKTTSWASRYSNILDHPWFFYEYMARLDFTPDRHELRPEVTSEAVRQFVQLTVGCLLVSCRRIIKHKCYYGDFRMACNNLCYLVKCIAKYQRGEYIVDPKEHNKTTVRLWDGDNWKLYFELDEIGLSARVSGGKCVLMSLELIKFFMVNLLNNVIVVEPTHIRKAFEKKICLTIKHNYCSRIGACSLAPVILHDPQTSSDMNKIN